MNIKSSISLKKLLKIIDYIFFNYLSKIYIKNEDNWYDEPFLEPCELLFTYFDSNFAIEKITKKKYAEFLQTCFFSLNKSKRIFVFIKYFLKCSYKTFLYDRKYNHNFIQKYIILFIESLKELDLQEKTIIYSEENENICIYLIYVRN